ncbi:hypothetical protein fugu_009819 [Takifugu bimaculatus]|uniref:Peptidase M12B propeptide domain-containing protein n=1 Tax=Takifugu bimaculatus TaxID=433685 RepID=A0A4Z2CDL8_9TELE|nr:hypothetical protein fugu_009819 [Takifugu bimaculatus]
MASSERRTGTPPLLHLFCFFALSRSALWHNGADGAASHPEVSELLRVLNLPLHTEYEIVSPYEVTHQGHYISHEVGHHHRRRRRSVTPGASSTINGGGETVHFRLSGLGQDFHLELQETSDGLIAPGFTIQVLGTNGTKSLRAYQKHDLCFYQGSLRSRVNSSVALSTCTGMPLERIRINRQSEPCNDTAPHSCRALKPDIV